MANFLEKQFKLSENGTTVRRELIAGLTTFLTMAYILATIPRMLEPLGFGQASILTMMVLLVAATSIAMGLYTNRPFALAPGLGSVGIVASFVTNDGVDPSVAAGVVFWSGVLFVLISLLGLREAVVKAIPKSLKHAVSAGVGLFIALLGAKNVKLIVGNEAKNCLSFGDLTSPAVILTVIGFIIIMILKMRKVKGDLFIGIILTTLIGIPFGVTKLPGAIVAAPAGIGSMFLKVDVFAALKVAYIPILISLFVPDFFSTVGTVLGVGGEAGYLDENGDLPGIDRCFKVDALATCVGGLCGIPNITTYMESSAGVAAGGRTGLTVIFTSVCFLLSMFLSPLALMIPSAATSAALIYIGVHMLSNMRHIDYTDLAEYFPAFLCVTFTIFANNIANGICVAIPAYVILHIASGRAKKVSPAMYVMTLVCILYFVTII